MSQVSVLMRYTAFIKLILEKEIAMEMSVEINMYSVNVHFSNL